MAGEGEEVDREQWLRVEELYYTALQLTAGERTDFIARACGGNAALREEVASLLAADDDAADFLREPAADLGIAILADESLYDTLIDPGLSPKASADLNGTTVAGRYEVIERLDEGGFGEVYKALDANVMSRHVIIKVLKDTALRGEGEKREWLLTKFRQEIEALSRIQDAGVVGIFDASTLPDGRPYLVLEFVRGYNLRDFIKRDGQEPGQGLKLRDAAEIVRQVGRTLTAAHDEQVVHRDLKPENIMVRRGSGGDLHVKVIDFGIAKVRNSLVARSAETANFSAGTWPYMAPEQLQRKKVDAACDTYALGVIAYELVTGRHPFGARDAGLLKELQAAGVKVMPRDLNPELPAAAQDAILRALSYYPADRHERARDFGDELARALSGEEELLRPPAPTPPGSQEPTLRKTRGAARAEPQETAGIQPASEQPASHVRRRVVLSVAGLLLAGAVGFIVWSVLKTTAPRTTEPQTRGPAAADAGSVRQLTYWLSMQRPHDVRPFDSTGERVFESGSQFWFNVQTTQEGALYLFGEGHEGGRPSELNTMYPTPKSGRGDARLATNKVGPVTEGSYRFRGTSGVIYLWVIWAGRPIPLLDGIVRGSYKTGGRISDAGQQAALRTFIAQHSDPKPEVLTDELGFRVTLKGQGKVLVAVRKLEYQP